MNLPGDTAGHFRRFGSGPPPGAIETTASVLILEVGTQGEPFSSKLPRAPRTIICSNQMDRPGGITPRVPSPRILRLPEAQRPKLGALG